MSHRRKSKDKRKAERESKDVETLCIPHITLDITDLLLRDGHVPIPEEVKAIDPSVSFSVDGGMIEYGYPLHLTDVFESIGGDLHYTFSDGTVSMTITRSDMEVLLRIGKQA